MRDTGLSRQLGLRSMTLAVVTSTIGSGWLFAPFYAARFAGPAALGAWLLGGLLAFALALVFAELGALVTSSGALAQIPLLSHGRTAGFIGGWCAWVSYLALPSIEVMAVMQYLASSAPWLTADGGAGQVLSGAGLALASLLLVLLAWINLAGVGWLARWIDGLTSWKLVVPLVVSITLMLMSGHWGNLVPLAQPVGTTLEGMVRAISSGGILFSLLGFRTAMDLAGEARQPQRTVPIAMALGLGLSLLIYLLLQLAFLVAVPPDQLTDGWARLRLSAHGGPLVALALGLGLGWVGRLLLLDAVVSPTATAMAYMGAASRVGWMMGRCGLLPNVLGRINRQAVPSVALLISLALGIGLLLLGPGWQSVVSLLTATLVIALAMGPVSLAALRLQLPDRFRPYRLPWARLWCPLAFVLATWAISWCGTTSLRGAVLIVLLPAIGFVLLALRGRQHEHHSEAVQTHAPLNLRQGLWWFLYLGGLVAITAWPLQLSAELILLGVWALLVFPLAVGSRLSAVSPWASTCPPGFD
ncbi:APC family permease [Synechococcus sp. CS-1329]|uniref:APC family permease n=1 Tax=Synechococcus sp. CS-1329 TaxID=2847975 RepID=UPI00223B6682|nr:APC family permease [Synechococcus sp. CS-1329]MCT0219670.1 APC family permease [Synechococcus sp. CS-1329]